MDIFTKINDIFSGGNVKRHHNYPIIDRQSVAEHTWRLVIVLDHLWPDLLLDPSVIRKALYHDVSEYKTGDVPANAKWRSPSLAIELHRLQEEDDKRLGIDVNISLDDFRKIKFCDRIEHMIFCLEQRRMGNRNVDRPFFKLVEFVKSQYEELIPTLSRPYNLFYNIQREYESQLKDIKYVGGHYE